MTCTEPASFAESSSCWTKRKLIRALVPWFILTAILAVSLTIALDLRNKDLSVPFLFEGDTMYTLSNVKAVIDTGWYWQNPQLSAPYVLNLIAFPSNNSVDYLLVWVTSRFTASPGLALNLAWLLTFLLTGTVALFCLYHLGVHVYVAVVFAALYAFLPFAFFRAAHFTLTFYLAPFGCTLAIFLASSDLSQYCRNVRVLILIGCALIGFNYIYNAFFSLFLLLLGTAIGYAKSGDQKILRAGIVASAVICVTSVLNLAPTLYSWQNEGKPYQDYKSPNEAEVYGLKLRHLVSPLPDHQIGFLKKWLAKEQKAAFPLENENSTSRLGIIPSIGFLLLVAVPFFPSRLDRYIPKFQITAAAQLNLGAFLLATVGGFGALFNLLLVPDIRCYNRIVVYIGFLSLFSLASIGSELVRRWNVTHPRIVVVCLALFLVFGIFDQQHAAVGLRSRSTTDAERAQVVGDIVQLAEGLLPVSGLVYEMPDTPFPLDSGRFLMRPYDNAMPHLFSRRLRWSWPNFSLQHRQWQAACDSLPPVDLVRYLRSSGFDAIWLDRNGYADATSSPEAALQQVVGDPALSSRDGRYIIFDLRRFIPVELRSRWEGGFYVEEKKGQETWRWCSASGELRLTNTSKNTVWVRLNATLRTGWPEDARIRVSGEGFTDILVTNAKGLEWERIVGVPPGEYLVRFTSDAKKHPASGVTDSRLLVFALYNFTMTRVEPPAGVAPRPIMKPLVEMTWGAGSYPEETGTTGTWHWCSASCEVFMVNPSTTPTQIRISMGIRTGHKKAAKFTILGPGLSDSIPVTSAGRTLSYNIDLPPGSHSLKMSCDAPRLSAPEDPRNMVFMVSNFVWRRVRR